jgi:hypothetical protein
MTHVTLAVTTDAKFNYRENKETKVKRPSLELKVPTVTVAAIAEYLGSEDPKVVSLVVDNIQAVITNLVRSYADGDVDFSQEKLDALIAEGKIALEVVANLPRSERNSLTNEDLAAFGAVYFKLAQELLGKSEGQATAAVVVFNSRVKKIAGNVAALNKVKADLETFLEKADDAVIEEHARSLQYLTSKIDEYLAEDITEDSL